MENYLLFVIILNSSIDGFFFVTQIIASCTLPDRASTHILDRSRYVPIVMDTRSGTIILTKLVEQNIPHLVPLFSTHVHGLIQYAVTYLIRTRRLRETSPVTMEVNRANDISMKWIL